MAAALIVPRKAMVPVASYPLLGVMLFLGFSSGLPLNNKCLKRGQSWVALTP